MNLDQIRLANEDDLPQLCNFYKDVSDHQSQDQFSAQFNWGVYPNQAGLQEKLNNAQIMTGWKSGRLASVGILTTGEDYPDVAWPHSFSSEQIGILHLYAVHPDFRGQGLSSEVLQSIIKLAKEDGKKVLHLDVLADNIPAAKLYEKNCFKVVSRQTYHYDDIGDQPAILMEHLL